MEIHTRKKIKEGVCVSVCVKEATQRLEGVSQSRRLG